MFERYTEKARRVIFFARYEASQFGKPQIETEHLLMGILREDRFLVQRLKLNAEELRSQIESNVVVRNKVSTSVDLPLSNESKRVLAYAAEEAERMRVRHIGPEHLLLGLLREDRSVAAELLRNAGMALDVARKEIALWPTENPRFVPSARPVEALFEFVEGEQVVCTALPDVMCPQTGDEVELEVSDGTQKYKVEAVRFVYERNDQSEREPIQRLRLIRVLVTRMPEASEPSK